MKYVPLSRGAIITRHRNLLERTEMLNFTPWGTTNITITANSISGPNNMYGADLATNASSGADTCYFNQVTPFNSGIYTLSFHAKPNTGSWVCASIGQEGVSNNYGWFNLATNSLGSTNTGITNGKIDIEGTGGWNRYYVTFNLTAGTLTILFQLPNADAGTTATLNDKHYFWGFQLEAGSRVTTYIPRGL